MRTVPGTDAGRRNTGQTGALRLLPTDVFPLRATV